MRTLAVLLWGGLATVWFASRVIWAAIRNSPTLACRCWEAPRYWSREILRAAGVTVEWEGVEHLEEGRPVILVPNHESWFDVFALAAGSPVDYRFVGKKELTRVPFFGRAWILCEHIAIDRGDRASAIASLDEAGQKIRDEKLAVIIFPEGTRAPGAEMLPFKKGAFVLAIRTGVAVVPVGISGGRDVMPKGSWRIRSGTIRIRIGEPIPVDDLGDRDRDELIRRTRTQVDRLRRGEIRPPEGTRTDPESPEPTRENQET